VRGTSGGIADAGTLANPADPGVSVFPGNGGTFTTRHSSCSRAQDAQL
jgi:hypothetical protein